MDKLAENSAKLRRAADALDLEALTLAIKARAGLTAEGDQTEEQLRAALEAGVAARYALEALKRSFAAEGVRLGQMRTGFAGAGGARRIDCRG